MVTPSQSTGEEQDLNFLQPNSLNSKLKSPLPLTNQSLLTYSPLHNTGSGSGKKVQILRGPAAVTGDETRKCHCLKA